MSSLNVALADKSPKEQELLVVDANHSAGWLDFGELWRYRELIWIFAVRDVTVKYRQTVVGITWTVLQPLLTMVAFGVLKTVLEANRSVPTIPEDALASAVPVAVSHVPDAVLTFCGLILYQLFSGILGASTLCLVDNRQIVTKVYFPRIALPISACLRPMLDFSIGLVVFTFLMIWFRVPPPHIWIVLSPIVVLLTAAVGLSFGLWLSALNAHYRDFGYIVPFLLNLGLIISPVAYEASKIPDAWRWLYFVNPMATLLTLFRASIFGTVLPGWDEVLISAASTLFLLSTGAWYFHRVDRFMADNI